MLILQTDRDTLLKPLLAVSGVVEKRHTLPILSSVLLQQQDSGLRLLASDLEIQMHSHSAAQVPEGFQLATSAKKLQDILRALPERASVRLEQNAGQLTLKSGASRFHLQTLPAADFPLFNADGAAQQSFSLPQRELKRMLSQVSFAMAGNDIRCYLNGLVLQTRGPWLRLIAADGHRMAFAACALPQALADSEQILPRKAVLELARQLQDSEQPVQIELLPRQIAFELGHCRMLSKLLDAKAPDYLRLLPEQHDCLLQLPRQPLLDALQRVAILAHNKFRHVQLAISPGELKICCHNGEVEQAEEQLNIDWQGHTFATSFNIGYLLDLLANLAADTLQFAFGSALRGVLVSYPADPEFKYLLMPLRA